MERIFAEIFESVHETTPQSNVKYPVPKGKTKTAKGTTIYASPYSLPSHMSVLSRPDYEKALELAIKEDQKVKKANFQISYPYKPGYSSGSFYEMPLTTPVTVKYVYFGAQAFDPQRSKFYDYMVATELSDFVINDIYMEPMRPQDIKLEDRVRQVSAYYDTYYDFINAGKIGPGITPPRTVVTREDIVTGRYDPSFWKKLEEDIVYAAEELEGFAIEGLEDLVGLAEDAAEEAAKIVGDVLLDSPLLLLLLAGGAFLAYTYVSK